jgi:transposase
MDTGQYTHGIPETQFILVIESLPGDSIAYAKNLKVLTGKKLNAVRAASGIQRLELPSSSPDLNPIGNLSAICKNMVWQKWRTLLFAFAQTRNILRPVRRNGREWIGFAWPGPECIGRSCRYSGMFRHKVRTHKALKNSLY